MFSDVLSGWWKRQMGFDFCFTGKNAQILCFFCLERDARRAATSNLWAGCSPESAAPAGVPALPRLNEGSYFRMDVFLGTSK